MQDELRKLAESTPYSMDTVTLLWREWGDYYTVKNILNSAMVSGESPWHWSEVFDVLYGEIDRTNYKAMDELWLIILQEGWY